MHFSTKSLANTLKDAGCQVFFNTLDKIDGVKDLVLSKSILLQLDSICGMKKLRQNAVDRVFELEEEKPFFSDSKNRVYVLRPSIGEVRQVSNQINQYLANDDEKSSSSSNSLKFWIIFVPRLVHYCDLALEEEGIYEYVSILECPIGLIPLEYDLYSLEDSSIFKTLYLHRDTTPISDIVDSITQLQILSGNICNVSGHGKFAEIVIKKLEEANLKRQIDPVKTDFSKLGFDDTPNDLPSKSTFTDIFLYDRDSDYASVMLSQLNYEGILDESFNICCNKLEFTSDEGKTTTKHSLSSESDQIFRDIRDIHFSTLFSLLKTKNHDMKSRYTKSQDMNITNLRNFVANELKDLQNDMKCLGLHISACEEILSQRNKYEFSDQLKVEQAIIDGVDIRKCLDHIDKIIKSKLHPYVPLRLLALISMTQGGLPPKEYSKYHALYSQIYGLFNNATFKNLKKLGLITEMDVSLSALTGGLISYGSKPSSSLASITGAMSSRMASVLPRRGNLSLLLKKYQLVPPIGDDGYNYRDPDDPAFVFGGSYIPLITRLIEAIPIFKKNQTSLGETPKQDQTILVFFIGGVTFAEVTALRFIAKRRNIKIAIATTAITNGNKLIESMLPILTGQ